MTSLCICVEAMIGSNTPLKNLNNPKFKVFLEKQCNQSVSDESSLRKSYIAALYKDFFYEIDSDLGDNAVWIMKMKQLIGGIAIWQILYV